MEIIQSLQDRSEHGLRSILENIHDFVVVLDREGRFLYINHVKDEENWRQVRGTSIFMDHWMSRETQGKLRVALEAAFERGESSKFEMLGIAIGDRQLRHWYSSRLHPLRADGRVIAAVYVSTEITDQRRAQQTIKDQKELQDAILSAMGDGVYALDTAHRVTLWNRAMERMTGIAAGEIAGSDKPVWEFIPTLSREFLGEIEAGLAGGEMVRRERSVNLEGEKEARHYIGYYHSLKVDGEARGLVGIVRDVTKARRAQAEREEMLDRMRSAQKLESLGVLAGGIAHDFNNLLVSILGYADLAQLELPDSSRAVGMLNQIRVAAQRAADLCRQMLAYAGKGKFVVQTVDVNGIIREMVGLLEVSISKKAALRFELSQEPLPVEADASQISQVIMNLIINANDAIGERNGTITVHTCVRDCDPQWLASMWSHDALVPGRYAEIEVSDTGCGMDKETVARIFEPFFTTKFSGRGLGMAAVLGIVRGHRGAIKIYSEPGKGSTFKVVLPLAEQSAAATSTSRHDDLKVEGCTVLVVDDDPLVREFMETALGVIGLNVLTASGGREAVDRLSEAAGRVQLVILDMTMPEMDGAETFSLLRKAKPDVRVILTSGYNEQEAVNRFAGKGLAAFLQKPFTIESLKSKIAEAMR